jgi:hypothetical protein
MHPYFIATERFDPTSSRWQTYIRWSKLTQLTDVITLDTVLCPAVVSEIDRDMWSHIVNENFMLTCFTDLQSLLARIGHARSMNVLAVMQNPAGHPSENVPEGFSFKGFDLVERMTQVSALTNCGGYPEVFANSELNPHGLLDDFARALQVQRELREKHPEEPHATCDRWAIYRSESLSRK